MFPTKKEGKYIVKLRETRLSSQREVCTTNIKQSVPPILKDKSFENLTDIDTQEEESVEINKEESLPTVKKVKSRPTSRKANHDLHR